MNFLNNQTSYQQDSEHVFSLFYEIKQEHPFMDDTILMKSLNQITGWEYPSARKNEFKHSVLKMLMVKN